MASRESLHVRRGFSTWFAQFTRGRRDQLLSLLEAGCNRSNDASREVDELGKVDPSMAENEDDLNEIGCALFTSLCCFLPLGIVAAILTVQVS